MAREFIDFAAIKERVSMEDAVSFLGLKQMERTGDQCRYQCPACKGNRDLSVNLGKQVFKCFSWGKGGTDSIALVAHARGIRQREAAVLLDQAFPDNRATSPARELDGRREPQEPSCALSVEHDALDALGLSAATCEALGAGYSPLDERVLIPLRLPSGQHIGHLGIATREDQAPLLLFPPDLDDKVKPTQPDALRRLFRVV